MLIEKYDEKPKFELGLSPSYFISYPLFNIHYRSILHKYINIYDRRKWGYNNFVALHNLNLKLYITYIYNSLQQIYKNEGVAGLYKGIIPMLIHVITKNSVYYFFQQIHFTIWKRMKKKRKKNDVVKKKSKNYERKYADEECTDNFIRDFKNYKIVKYIDFVKEENNFIKNEKRKKKFYLSFYHSFYDYISNIIAYPFLNISTRMIVFQNNSHSLIENLKNIINLTYQYDGYQGFFKGLNNYLAIETIDKVLNCFLYFLFSDNYPYDKVLTIRMILSTCLKTVLTPYINYSILNRAQSYVPGLCKFVTYNEFFNEFHWKSYFSSVSFSFAIAGIQLIMIMLLRNDNTKNDELFNEEKDEYF